MTGPAPLDGLRVIELSTGVLGPLCGVYLADMGAEVVKVEPPEGDLTRYNRGVGNELPPEAPSPMFLAMNRGKRSVVLDGLSEDGREALLRLVRSADVFLSNFRPEALAKLGVSYDAVCAVNPDIVYATATGFGHHGADASLPMVDGAGQARGGLAGVTGDADGPPVMVGAIVADTAGAMQLALGTVTALLARERHGPGQRVDVSALGSQLWLQAWELTHASMTGWRPTRDAGHHPIFTGVYGMYRTADGVGLFLGIVTEPDDWKALCEFGGIPEVAGDPRWDTQQKRVGYDPSVPISDVNALRPHLRGAVATRTAAEWDAFLKARPEIVAHPVHGYDEVLADAQAAANGYFTELDVPGAGRVRVVGNLVELSATPGAPPGGPPAKGEHTEEMLMSVGYSAGEVKALVAAADEALVRKFESLMIKPPDDR